MIPATTAADPPASPVRRRGGAVAVFAGAATVAALTGCSLSPAESSGPQMVGHAIAAELEAMPGVEAVTVERAQSTGLVDLDVRISPQATGEQIGDIGVAASVFPESEFSAGSYPGDVELSLGRSLFSYFSLAGEQALREQLGYWHGLVSAGLETVNVRTHTPQPPPEPPQSGPVASGLEASGPQQTPGGFTLSNSRLGRFVSIALPEGLDAAGATALLDAARAVPDPGAAGGVWVVAGVTDSSRGQFASPEFPSSEDLRVFTDMTGVFEGLGAPGTLQFTLDREASPQAVLDVAAFDGSLEGVPQQRAEPVFRDTLAWQQLKRAVARLDSTGLDFGVSIMSNPLADASNFQLEVRVIDCTFVPDRRWNELSRELSEAWLLAREAREPGSTASGGCAVGR
ncbi:MAG: hypothetical protein Q4E05_02700 [Pseudoclavibacter sp.]|nr:hypothetical protein [Pseudoclavibacter sp.]